MRVTVGICTWNRARSLERTLESVRGLRVPAGVAWDVLVVNNNSVDDTETVLASFADKLPLRALFEPRQGISFARNRLFASAAADLMLCADDDVILDPAWLRGYVRAAARWPSAGYFGGPISPRFEQEPPLWCRRNLATLHGLLGIRDLGGEERPFAGQESPFGGNMAFRRRVFSEASFDESLGVRGGERLLGEETALCDALRRRGEQGVWVPSAPLLHCVPPRFLTREYVGNYFFGYGRTVLRMQDPAWLWLLRYPRWLIRLYGLLVQGSAAIRYVAGSSSWLPPFTRQAILRGMLDEARRPPSRAGLVSPAK